MDSAKPTADFLSNSKLFDLVNTGIYCSKFHCLLRWPS